MSSPQVIEAEIVVEAVAEPKPWLWKKGQSGNPRGRPKGPARTEIVRDFMESVHPFETELAKRQNREARTVLDVVVDKLGREAMAGNVKASILLLAYYLGKPTSKLQVEGSVDHTHSHEHGPTPEMVQLMLRLAELREKQRLPSAVSAD